MGKKITTSLITMIIASALLLLILLWRTTYLDLGIICTEPRTQVHVADIIIEDDDLNTPESIPKGTDQHDPIEMIKESDKHPCKSKWKLDLRLPQRCKVRLLLLHL